MPFSHRTPEDMSPNTIARAQERVGSEGLLDLTESNPTHCGFEYPPQLLSGLGQSASLSYEPFPFGHPEARQTVADYLNSKGERVDPEKVVLTASTSEAYSFLFKLLADPGDSILVPTPGYPLLEHLGRLEGIEVLPYPFRLQEDWPVDLVQTRKAAGPRSKGLVVVDPQNPTGAFLSREDREALGGVCRERGLAFILDEVFSDYAYVPRTRARTPEGVLSFRLGGLSKSLGLPQLKLSWVVLDGPQALLDECRDRFELICDSYLSVNTPVQRVLKDLLAFAPDFQGQLLKRVLSNRKLLAESLEGLSHLRLWPAQGGWYALVEIREGRKSEEEWVLELLQKDRVLVQPGGFYDFPEGRFLVMSLLVPSAAFQEAVGRIKRRLA